MRKEKVGDGVENQDKFEQFKLTLIKGNERKYGGEAIGKTNARLKELTEYELEESKRLRLEFEKTLEAAFHTGDPAGELAQKACDLHRKWLCIYNPRYDRDYHLRIGDLYVANERFKANCDKLAAGCAGFLRDAINSYWKRAAYLR